jgi:hypothetical protein
MLEAVLQVLFAAAVVSVGLYTWALVWLRAVEAEEAARTKICFRPAWPRPRHRGAMAKGVATRLYCYPGRRFAVSGRGRGTEVPRSLAPTRHHKPK